MNYLHTDIYHEVNCLRIDENLLMKNTSYVQS